MKAMLLAITLVLASVDAAYAQFTPITIDIVRVGGTAVAADPAHGSPYGSANSVPQACYAVATLPSEVDANDKANIVCNLNGVLYAIPTASKSGGATPLAYISVGTTEDKHAVCTAPCNLYGIQATNTNAAVRYLKCENDTSANTAPGTDTPEFRLAIPPGSGFIAVFPVGKFFSVALTCWTVTGAADSDVAEVAANEIMLNYDFKQ